MQSKIKIMRACTVPQSLSFVAGMIPELKQRYELVLLSSDGPEWAAVEQAHPDVRCLRVNMARHISLLGDLKSLLKMIAVMHREHPCMVHSMTPKAGLLCMLAAWLCRVPVRVHTFTGLVFPTATGLKRRVLMLTDAITCFCATHVIAEGQGVRNDLLTHRITRKDVRVLGHGNVKGIDLGRFSRSDEVLSQAATVGDGSTFTFLTVGRVVGDKGINEMVDAFVRLNREFPTTRLIIVGAYEENLDPVKAETRAEIDSNPAIVAVGPQADVRPWYAASQVYVSASYREGFPNTVIEAGAMSLPCIVTNINGSREIVADGENGIIVEPHDAQALYAAMCRMLTDEAARKAMAAKARPMVASRYEQGYVRRCLYDFYGEVLGDAGPSA